MLGRGCASVENTRVSGVGKALNWRGLVVRRGGGELCIVIIVIVVAVEDRGYEIPFAAAGFGERFALGSGALKHEGAELAGDAGVLGCEDAIGNGCGNFGEQAVDMGVVDGAAGDGFQFADEIGGAKPAVRGVGMVVAEAVGLWSGGEGAAASIGKAESAAGEVGGGGMDGTVRRGIGGNPIGRLRVDISGRHHRSPTTGPRRMSKALASHGESLAK
jgi:hypothetical protein